MEVVSLRNGVWERYCFHAFQVVPQGINHQRRNQKTGCSGNPTQPSSTIAALSITATEKL